MKVDIINLSNGGIINEDDILLQEKITELLNTGIIVVAAAGNEGPQYGTINSPANIPGVIAVGSLDGSGKKVSSFSSRGFAIKNLTEGIMITKPDILTYGENILATDKGKNCRSRSGTSCSAAIICGFIATAISLKRSINPNFKTNAGQYF